VLVAHLSDLHLRTADDVIWLDRQLDRIVARNPDHVAITGDLLDRWSRPLLARALDAIDRHGLMAAGRLSLLHGNHDLASSGGYPRRHADLWRIVLRSWDPPPLMASRRHRFYRMIEARATGIASPAPFVKTLSTGARIAILDTVPTPWRPIRITRRAIVIRHGMGCIRASQARWLAALPHEPGPLVTLVHHCPLEVPPFRWVPPWNPPALRLPQFAVAMHIPEEDRQRFWTAASAADTTLVLCGHVHRCRLAHVGGIAVGVNGRVAPRGPDARLAGTTWYGAPCP
jgi:predicted phosphodiesterase